MTFQELKDLLTKPIGAPKATNASSSSVAAAPQPRNRALTDVVGVELGSSDSRGCPAVRLTKKKDRWMVKSVGFVPPPSGNLPTSWKDLDNQPTWSLSSEFSAPSAALAVNSAEQVVRQTTKESLTEGGKPLVFGSPNSRDGLRFTVEDIGESSFVLESGLPEFQVLWLSRLLPEGKRPTAASVQTAPAAMLATLAEQSQFNAAGGNAAALFVTGASTYFVGYRGGKPVLFREFPGVGGLVKMRAALATGFGMEEKMLDEVLDDTLIDPTPILSPIVNPVLRQLELSLDYLKSRLGVSVDKVFLMGLSSGTRHWCKMSEDMLNVKLVAPDLFEGMDVSACIAKGDDALLRRSHQFMVAYGAARAAMEVAE